MNASISVFGCPPDDGKSKKGENKQLLLETIHSVVVVWSKRDFVQSAPFEQQVHITAAAGLMLETMWTQPRMFWSGKWLAVLHLFFQRQLTQKILSSLTITSEEDVDWEFGLATSKVTYQNSESEEIATLSSILEQKLEPDHGVTRTRGSKVNTSKKRSSNYKSLDSNEVDQKKFNGELLFSEEEDDCSSEDSEGSSESSLQPYDLTDDDTDLKKKISQLVDIVGALLKTNDPHGVERALDVAEKFIRASPDELRHVASDLVKTLIQGADIVVEGEESAEEKR